MEDQKMGSMPINKLLLTMAAPMILSMVIGALYNIVDSIFIKSLQLGQAEWRTCLGEHTIKAEDGLLLIW